MKKIIFAAVLFAASFANAQISVEGNNGVQITDGYEYVTNQLGLEGEARLKILVTNNSEDETIRLKLKLVSMENANGNNEFIQFCFDSQCYIGVETGSTVPSATGGAILAPGGRNNASDHFANAFAGDTPGQQVVYNLAIIEVSATGQELGTLLTFSYTYKPTAGLSDFASLQQMGITINNTIVKNTLEVMANQDAKLEVININGQSVKNATIVSGSQSIDLSGLSSAVYFAKFTNSENKTSQIRIVKN